LSLRSVAVCIGVRRHLICGHADIDAERRLTRGLRLLTITIVDTLDHQDSENTPHECFVGLIQKLRLHGFLSALISSCGPTCRKTESMDINFTYSYSARSW
jgi:hypothetical protein